MNVLVEVLEQVGVFVYFRIKLERYFFLRKVVRILEFFILINFMLMLIRVIGFLIDILGKYMIENLENKNW